MVLSSLNKSPTSESPPPPPTHRVLSLYYPTLRTLSSLYPPDLVKDEDPERFKVFLRECLVGFTKPNPSLNEFKLLDKEDSSIGMLEILNQVLQRVFTVHAKQYEQARKSGLPAFSTPKHILAAGHRLVSGGQRQSNKSGGGVKVGTGPTFEEIATNTIASEMTGSKQWATLLARVGPDSILKLLSNDKIAMFQPVGNGCYIQISGIPVAELKVYDSSMTDGGGGKVSERKNGGKGGRKTHVRTVKKRGKKKKAKSAETNSLEGEKKGIGGVEDQNQEREEQVNEGEKMELDQAPSDSTSIAPASRGVNTRKALGPSGSAPTLLTTTNTSATRSIPQIAQTQVQPQLSAPPSSAGIPLRVTASTQPIPRPSGTQVKSTLVAKAGLVTKKEKSTIVNSYNSIVFSRHRIYHARMSKSKGGKIDYGLSPKHILSRLGQNFTLPTSAALPSDASSSNQTTSHLYSSARHLSKYLFPRQFGLDNVFEGEKVNLWIRIRPDHEDRELEIKKLGTMKTPSRLKGQIIPLLNRMIVLNQRCNYRKLLGIKCPSKVSHKEMDEEEKKSLITDLMSEPPATQLSRTNAAATLPPPPSCSLRTTSQINPASSGRIPDSQQLENQQMMDYEVNNEDVPDEGDSSNDGILRPKSATGDKKPKLAEYACTPYEVESYVQAVVRDVIPRAFWGSERNKKLLMKQISQYLRMRRFESISLHSLLQGFSILDCEWLDPSSDVADLDNNKKQDDAQQEKLPKKSINPIEMEKRKEVLSEFLYWLFDSFITDLVRTSFYVTDSATHQNRPLYFRQDDWKALTAPLLESLGKTVFERVPDNQVIALERQPRELSFSYVRLLPKEAGVRPIVNLARRPIRIGPNGEKEVGQPINMILRSVFDVLTYESKRKPELVGSLVTNPQEIYAKLKEFKTRLLESDETGTGELSELYFVKVDVKSCFDTIKQDKLLALVEEILSEAFYYIQKYSQVVAYSGKTARMFKRQACISDDLGPFRELAMRLAENLHDVVLSDQVRYDQPEKEKLMALLKEHITTNLVKVNGHLYRQKDGIPQGSILSSLLCSLFYGDMEKTCLSFTKDPKSLLLRYVDDFMFVTTKKHLAVRFLQTMHDGIPEYGCFVSTEKRLTNFDVSLDDGEIVPPLPADQDFGYCGLAIDTKTLEIKMNLQLQMNKEIVNQLTVQRYRKPGEAFVNAMLRAIKVRAHSMYTDTNFNSRTTVYSNIYQAMLVVALKFQAYVQDWCGSLKGKITFFWNALEKIVKYEHSALVRQGRNRKAAKLSASFDLERSQVIWLGYHAFHRVLSRSPATFSPLLRLLLVEVKTPRIRPHLSILKKIVNDEKNGFVDKVAGHRR